MIRDEQMWEAVEQEHGELSRREAFVTLTALEWADRTMIEKACEWITEHIFDFPWYDDEQGDFSSKDVANALRKAMEE